MEGISLEITQNKKTDLVIHFLQTKNACAVDTNVALHFF